MKRKPLYNRVKDVTEEFSENKYGKEARVTTVPEREAIGIRVKNEGLLINVGVVTGIASIVCCSDGMIDTSRELRDYYKEKLNRDFVLEYFGCTVMGD